MFGTSTLTRRSTAATLLLLTGALSHLPAQRDSLAQVKSPVTALALSLGATALPYVLMTMGSRDSYNGRNQNAELAILGLFVGPAVGHFYAGQPVRALTGMGIRAGLFGATALLAQVDCDGFLCIPPGVLIGGLALITDIIVDIAAAPSSARKTNAEHARLALVPLNDGPRTRLGVGVRLPF